MLSAQGLPPVAPPFPALILPRTTQCRSDRRLCLQRVGLGADEGWECPTHGAGLPLAQRELSSLGNTKPVGRRAVVRTNGYSPVTVRPSAPADKHDCNGASLQVTQGARAHAQQGSSGAEPTPQGGAAHEG